MLRPFTLSSGQVIPAGVVIEVPSHAISYDNDIYPDADQFDPLRFYKLRQRAKEDGATEGAAQNQFVSVSKNSLTFGYGRHACPGRFFAANEIKMIVANALLGYDIKCIEGTRGRYPNMEFGTQVSCCSPIARPLSTACICNLYADDPCVSIPCSLFLTRPRCCCSRRLRESRKVTWSLCSCVAAEGLMIPCMSLFFPLGLYRANSFILEFHVG